MKLMRVSLWGVLILALVGIASTFVAEAGFRQRAQTVQIVSGTVSDAVLDGEPVVALVVPPLAGRDVRPDGVAVLNRQMDHHAHEFIPLSTITVAAFRARLGGLAAALAAVVGLMWVRAGHSGPFQRPPDED